MVPFLLALAASVALVVGLIAFARARPGYRHAVHTISELGERGARHEKAVALGLFAPVGTLCLAAAALLLPADKATAALAGCLAAGYLVAAAFPCDPGSPLSGSARQAVHILGGGIEYVGGGFALFAMAHAEGPAFRWAGIAVLVAAGAISFMPPGSPRGLVQRLAETALFGGLLLATARLAGIAQPA